MRHEISLRYNAESAAYCDVKGPHGMVPRLSQVWLCADALETDMNIIRNRTVYVVLTDTKPTGDFFGINKPRYEPHDVNRQSSVKGDGHRYIVYDTQMWLANKYDEGYRYIQLEQNA